MPLSALWKPKVCRRHFHRFLLTSLTMQYGRLTYCNLEGTEPFEIWYEIVASSKWRMVDDAIGRCLHTILRCTDGCFHTDLLAPDRFSYCLKMIIIWLDRCLQSVSVSQCMKWKNDILSNMMFTTLAALWIRLTLHGVYPTDIVYTRA
jgi:hypothetical protein